MMVTLPPDYRPSDTEAFMNPLQVEYFQRLTRPLEPALDQSDARFLREPDFAPVFARFVERHDIIEHCVLMQPPGILGLDVEGNAAILLVADDDYRQASFEIALAEGAPPQLLKALIHSDALGVFPTASGFYSSRDGSPWTDYIWHGECFGRQGRRWAIIDKPEVVRQACRHVQSYAAHRPKPFH